MIIRIEDAPAVKHITIDIDFTGEGSTTIIQDGIPQQTQQKKTTLSYIDEPLNLDSDFTQEETVIEKPVIEELNRDVNVSSDMENLEI